jgi:hypothetical protein
MSTPLKTAVAKYLGAGNPARGTRDEYQTTLRKWKRWGRGVPIENLGRKEIREFLERGIQLTPLPTIRCGVHGDDSLCLSLGDLVPGCIWFRLPQHPARTSIALLAFQRGIMKVLFPASGAPPETPKVINPETNVTTICCR